MVKAGYNPLKTKTDKEEFVSETPHKDEVERVMTPLKTSTSRNGRNFNYRSYMAKLAKYDSYESDLILETGKLLIGVESRLLIVILLAEAPNTITGLAKEIRLSKSSISEHLKKMERAGIIEKENGQKMNFCYKLNPVFQRPDMERFLDRCIALTYDAQRIY